MFEDGLPSVTSTAQNALERKILPMYQELDGLDPDELDEFLELNRAAHVTYVQAGLGQLGPGFAVLDASRPWICYWLVHSLAMLDAPMPPSVSQDDVVDFLAHCQHPGGGFGGSPLQLGHLAPTYAAVAAAATMGSRKAYNMINRTAVWEFLLRMCVPPEQGGGFTVHDGGEVDLRACYTAMAVAHMLCLDKQLLVARSGVLDYIRRCQTFEGGLGGEPGNEAHGGYTFCGVAALALAGGPQCIADTLDVPRLVHWLVHRQGTMEGGFNGRTNKLVDGCYSFWQGGVFPLLATLPPAALRPPQVEPEDAPQADELVLPMVPMLGAQQPTDLADEEMSSRMLAYEQLRAEALAASEAADEAVRVAAARHSRDETAHARALLDKAAQAHEAAEAAATQFACANNAAYITCPPPDPVDMVPPANGAAQEAPSPTPLFNPHALQLWILRCCQPSKGGGLRDKPGKPVDYYHTCYCLSGLAAAQHVPGARCLGPRENQLKRTDAACNVVEDKLRAALRHFGAMPAVPAAAAVPATAGGAAPMDTGA